MATTLHTDDPVAAAAVDAIHTGDVDALRVLLTDHRDLPTSVSAIQLIRMG